MMVRIILIVGAVAALGGCFGWRYEPANNRVTHPTGCAVERGTSPETACFDCGIELVGMLSYRGRRTDAESIAYQRAEQLGADFIVPGGSTGGETQTNTLYMNSSTLTHQVTAPTTDRWLLFRRTHFPGHQANPTVRPPWLTAQMSCADGRPPLCHDVLRKQWCRNPDAPAGSTHGLNLEWHANGQLKSRGRYHDFNACGPWECWNEDGTPAACPPPEIPTCPIQ